MAGFELRDRRPESAGHHGASRATQSDGTDRKSTRLNSSHGYISYAVFCLKKKISAGKNEPPYTVIQADKKFVPGLDHAGLHSARPAVYSLPHAVHPRLSNPTPPHNPRVQH